MRFERYPLDEHICKFRVGSTNMDINYMRFGETALSFDKTVMNTILDYKVEATKLREEDRILLYQGQNYSVTGRYCSYSKFQMPPKQFIHLILLHKNVENSLLKVSFLAAIIQELGYKSFKTLSSF